MLVAKLGGGNNFALYWPNLVTLGTFSFWWKFRLNSLDPMLPSNLFLYGFCSLMSVFKLGINCSFLKVMLICTYTF